MYRREIAPGKKCQENKYDPRTQEGIAGVKFGLLEFN
jgi:hypothetical protein